jgi:phosphoglycerate kinase
MVGGGDTTAWLAKQPGLANKFTHISSGGGAALEYLANKGSLPVLDVLLSK